MFDKFKENDDVKIAIAVVLFDVIKSDNRITNEEITKFHCIFIDLFKVSKQESEALYNKASILDLQFSEYLEILEEKFELNVMLKINFMKVLNELILVDGIVDVEYGRFEKIRDKII